MSLDSALLIHHPTRAWSLDATVAGVDPEALDALPFDAAFAAMEALEEGAIANPDEGRQVGHYWLRRPEAAPTMGQARAIGETAQAVRAFAATVRDGELLTREGDAFTDVLHVGIGGSALGPQLLIDALGDHKGLSIHFLDNVDPDGIERVLVGLGSRLAQTLCVVVSKSGGTAETAIATELVKRRLVAAGLDVGSRMVAITGEGSLLHGLATEGSWCRVFPLWDWVGGRTSVMAAVGLLPGELAGIDTEALLRGAREMDDWTRAAVWRDNPAALMAGVWHAVANGRGDRNLVLLPYSDRLLTLSRYLQQLVMESLGKRLDLLGEVVHQGLSVYGNKGSTDQHAFVQQLRDGRNDALVTFVQVLGDGLGSGEPVQGQANAGDTLQGFMLGTRRALTDADRPSITLTVPQIDAHELGGLVALFERAVGLYASLIGVNAYHQPGVEAGKRAAVAVLELSVRVRDALTAEPAEVQVLALALKADPVEVLYVLQRLEATGRATRHGLGLEALYSMGQPGSEPQRS